MPMTGIADIAMGDTGIRRSIVSQLSSLYPGLYSDDNIALGSTHQHSGVGGYLENLLPQVTALGYVKETADAIVAGTVLAVQRAHASLAPGRLSIGNTSVVDGNTNRSPSAYLANPADERALYEYDQDKELSLLRFDDASGNARGFLSFFAVHGTSLYENNTLVSSDNKGMAAYLYEGMLVPVDPTFSELIFLVLAVLLYAAMIEPSAMPGNNTFVAGFTQCQAKRRLGAFCESPGKDYDGQLCDFNSSTCGGFAEDCHGRGPGFRISDFESNRIIAQLQVDGAHTLMNSLSTPSRCPTVPPSRRVLRLWVRIIALAVQLAAMLLTNHTSRFISMFPGFSFAGGTTDGPGAFDFVQGDNSSHSQNPFWEIVKGFVTPNPPPEQIACQYPKPILLDTGYANTPYQWSPHTVNIQMFRVGNLVMLIMPGELTTMAGRRMRNAIRTQLIAQGVLGEDAYVVIAGPANTYAHYVATKEEYSVQRYEGASTIFGQYTLDAYINKYGSLVSYLAENASGTPSSDPAPADLTVDAISLRTGVVFDSAGIGSGFGDVTADVSLSAYHAGDTVSAQFVGANPRVRPSVSPNPIGFEADLVLCAEQFQAGRHVPVCGPVDERHVADVQVRLAPVDNLSMDGNEH
ncbi:hypothetical protein EW146_g8799, partial [Bondarzewia mesenterica]